MYRFLRFWGALESTVKSHSYNGHNKKEKRSVMTYYFVKLELSSWMLPFFCGESWSWYVIFKIWLDKNVCHWGPVMMNLFSYWLWFLLTVSGIALGGLFKLALLLKTSEICFCDAVRGHTKRFSFLSWQGDAPQLICRSFTNWQRCIIYFDTEF